MNITKFLGTSMLQNIWEHASVKCQMFVYHQWSHHAKMNLIIYWKTVRNLDAKPLFKVCKWGSRKTMSLLFTTLFFPAWTQDLHLTLHKTLRRCTGLLSTVLCTLNVRPVSRG